MDKPLKINLGKFSVLKQLREQAEELTGEINALSEPMFEDLSLLPEVYEAYKRVFSRYGCSGDAMFVRNRKKFLLVVLYLFSPSALAGYRMRTGLRKKVSELFGLTTSTPISDNCAGLIVQYNAYADFRRDVDLIFQEVLDYFSMKNDLSLK